MADSTATQMHAAHAASTEASTVSSVGTLECDWDKEQAAGKGSCCSDTGFHHFISLRRPSADFAPSLTRESGGTPGSQYTYVSRVTIRRRNGTNWRGLRRKTGRFVGRSHPL